MDLKWKKSVCYNGFGLLLPFYFVPSIFIAWVAHSHKHTHKQFEWVAIYTLFIHQYEKKNIDFKVEQRIVYSQTNTKDTKRKPMNFFIVSYTTNENWWFAWIQLPNFELCMNLLDNRCLKLHGLLMRVTIEP